MNVKIEVTVKRLWVHNNVLSHSLWISGKKEKMGKVSLCEIETLGA